MASLVIGDDTVSVHLSHVEHVESVHGDLTVPRSCVVGARAVDDALREVNGLRFEGEGQGVILVGTVTGKDGTTFAVCHGNTPGLVVQLRDATYSRIVVSCDDGEACTEAVAVLGPL